MVASEQQMEHRQELKTTIAITIRLVALGIILLLLTMEYRAHPLIKDSESTVKIGEQDQRSQRLHKIMATCSLCSKLIA
jgi:hypothetical protein